MDGEQIALIACPGKRIRAGIMPNIAPVAAVTPELDVIAMRTSTMLEDTHELMLAAVKGTHTRVVLDPDADINDFPVDLASRS
jgi:uncharacterized protein (DUF4213/DUF364 family)